MRCFLLKIWGLHETNPHYGAPVGTLAGGIAVWLCYIKSWPGQPIAYGHRFGDFESRSNASWEKLHIYTALLLYPWYSVYGKARSLVSRAECTALSRRLLRKYTTTPPPLLQAFPSAKHSSGSANISSAHSLPADPPAKLHPRHPPSLILIQAVITIPTISTPFPPPRRRSFLNFQYSYI